MHRHDDCLMTVNCTCQLLPAVQRIAEKYKDLADGSADNSSKQQKVLFKNNSPRKSRSMDQGCAKRASEGVMNDDEEDNESPGEYNSRNKQKFSTMVANAQTSKNWPKVFNPPSGLIRVPNQSCPVHTKNFDPQSRLHPANNVNRFKSLSPSNSLILDYLKNILFSVDEDRNHSTENWSSWTHRITGVIIAIIGILLLRSVYYGG